MTTLTLDAEWRTRCLRMLAFAHDLLDELRNTASRPDLQLILAYDEMLDRATVYLTNLFAASTEARTRINPLLHEAVIYPIRCLVAAFQNHPDYSPDKLA